MEKQLEYNIDYVKRQIYCFQENAKKLNYETITKVEYGENNVVIYLDSSKAIINIDYKKNNISFNNKENLVISQQLLVFLEHILSDNIFDKWNWEYLNLYRDQLTKLQEENEKDDEEDERDDE